MGYYLAGFDVIGIDPSPQAQYPFPSIRRDPLIALSDARLLAEFDVIHAASPCRPELLDGLGIPWVVENVEMPGSVTLCGSHFNLGAGGHVLSRHRRFSASFPLPDPGPCSCSGKRNRGVCRRVMPHSRTYRANEARTAMGIDWMSRKGLALAIPPDYTRWVAEQLICASFPWVASRDHQHSRYSSGRVEQFAKL